MARDLTQWGSDTARGGFNNEKDIREKFADWQNDFDAQEWLETIGYDINDINKIDFNLPGRQEKTDLQLIIHMKTINEPDLVNLQIKLVSDKANFNQVDRRYVGKAVNEWGMPEDVAELLQYFAGEKPPYKTNAKDEKRMFINEFTEDEYLMIKEWLESKFDLIINDTIKGNGEFSVDWYLVANKANNRWLVMDIEDVIEFYSGDRQIKLSPNASLFIGELFLQRKGGDGGRPTGNMLQFKIKPLDLFHVEL